MEPHRACSVGLLGSLTATSAYDRCGGRVVGGIGRAEDVAEEFLDDDEVDALFQEQGCGRVTEIVEADVRSPGLWRRRRKWRVRLVGSSGWPFGVVKTRHCQSSSVWLSGALLSAVPDGA